MDITFLHDLVKDDIGFGDISSELLPQSSATGNIMAKELLYVSGIHVLEKFLSSYGLKVTSFKKEGERANPGEKILSVKGDVCTILSLERTALNILQRMCGITTLTRKCVDIVNGEVIIAGTRKTLLPYYDKMAIRAGGGDPHRWRLDDMIMIKDNHIEIMGIEKAVKAAKKISFTKKIEVEVKNTKEALEALDAGADIIMLDNMDPLEIKDTLSALGKYNKPKQCLFEASGNITPDNLRLYASTGIDIISMGWLTHSVKAADISLKIKR